MKHCDTSEHANYCLPLRRAQQTVGVVAVARSLGFTICWSHWHVSLQVLCVAGPICLTAEVLPLAA
jgi:hypothetical protein